MQKNKLLLLLVLLVTAATGAWAAEVTVTKTVHDLFPDDANGTQEATLYSDANLSISVNSDGNNGKVYNNGTEWRVYQTNSAVVTVTATEATIKSVEFTFTVKNNGIIKYDGNAMTSGTAVNVNAASAQFVAGKTGSGTNGIVSISGFTVVYETAGGSGEEAPTTKHLITATYDKQTRSLEQPLPYATTIGELYEAVTGEPFSDLISSMSALEMPLSGISSTKTDVVSIGDLNGASTPVTVKADGQATVSLKFGNYAKGIYLSVTPPLYVKMKDGVKDADKWTVKVGEGQAQALPIGGLKGDGSETVTLQYNGRLKVKGVKATSDAVPVPPAESKTLAESAVGELVGSDGLAYAAADKDKLPDGVVAAGMVAYKSGSNGLVIALTDDGSLGWTTASGSTTGAAAHTPTVTGYSWRLPTKDEWPLMFGANGGNNASYSGLNTAIENAGGTALVESWAYWTSTMSGESIYIVNLFTPVEIRTTPGLWSNYVRAVFDF